MEGAKRCQNYQKRDMTPFGTSQLGRSLKFNIESLTPSEREDYDTVLQERIAIMMFDGGLSEADAERIATEEVGRSLSIRSRCKCGTMGVVGRDCGNCGVVVDDFAAAA